MSSAQPPDLPDAFSAFGNTGRTGSGADDQKRVGVAAFSALVGRDGRTLGDAVTASFPIMEGTRTATIHRHRSGSVTEYHSDPSNGSHNAYHASVRDNKVYRLRG